MKKNIFFDDKVASSYYLADYFQKTRQILEKFKPNQVVTMQWFQRKDNVTLCGIEYIIQLIKFALPNWKDLEIKALRDGDIINANEPVLKIKGKYNDFAYLEGFIDGVLCRATSIATNSKKLVVAANGKNVLNMNDRADIYWNQQFDGYASYVGGMRAFVTEAAFEYIEDENIKKLNGTMPHSLIASFGGDIIKATEAFYETFPNNKLVSLIDYNNDCINDGVKVLRHFKDKLKMVRIDTSIALIDKSLQKYGNEKEYNGVNPTLVKELRKALDENGGKHVEIIVSSGLNEEKIKWFESENAPVDYYGIGEAITKEKINFTGDIVMVDGIDQAKVGRHNIESTRLKSII